MIKEKDETSLYDDFNVLRNIHPFSNSRRENKCISCVIRWPPKWSSLKKGLIRTRRQTVGRFISFSVTAFTWKEMFDANAVNLNAFPTGINIYMLHFQLFVQWYILRKLWHVVFFFFLILLLYPLNFNWNVNPSRHLFPFLTLKERK